MYQSPGLPSHVSTTARYVNVSTCCSVWPLTCRIYCLGFVEKHTVVPRFLALVFIPARSHAAENRWSAWWRPWFIGCHGVVRWSLCWISEIGRHAADIRLRFFISTISIILNWCPHQKFLHTIEWGPTKLLPVGPRIV